MPGRTSMASSEEKAEAPCARSDDRFTRASASVMIREVNADGGK